MSKWSLVNSEFYCMFDSMHKKKSTFYSYGKGLKKKDGSMQKPTKVETIDNPLYVKGDRPTWCKKKFPGRKERIPEFKCLGNGCDKCPFLMFTDVDKTESDVMNMAFNINCEKSWNDEKMKFDKKVSKKFIEHMLKFKEVKKNDK